MRKNKKPDYKMLNLYRERFYFFLAKKAYSRKFFYVVGFLEIVDLHVFWVVVHLYLKYLLKFIIFCFFVTNFVMYVLYNDFFMYIISSESTKSSCLSFNSPP